MIDVLQNRLQKAGQTAAGFSGGVYGVFLCHARIFTLLPLDWVGGGTDDSWISCTAS